MTLALRVQALVRPARSPLTILAKLSIPTHSVADGHDSASTPYGDWTIRQDPIEYPSAADGAARHSAASTSTTYKRAEKLPRRFGVPSIAVNLCPSRSNGSQSLDAARLRLGRLN